MRPANGTLACGIWTSRSHPENAFVIEVCQGKMAFSLPVHWLDASQYVGPLGLPCRRCQARRHRMDSSRTMRTYVMERQQMKLTTAILVGTCLLLSASAQAQ